MAVSEEPRQYLLKVDLPGWDREQVGIHVEDGMLQILGAQRQGSSSFTGGQHDVMSALSLPHDVDPCSVVADFRDGVLRVRLPRMSQKRSWWPG